MVFRLLLSRLGFRSILYELVWLRLAAAQFGITNPLVSIVLSMFMAGIGLGSWGAGWAIKKYGHRIKVPMLFYASIELLIGISAVAVPYQLRLGRHLLEKMPITSSSGYYLVSAVWICFTLVPWCACMGATIPVAMLAINQTSHKDAQRSFSFLYLANVLGALVGATVPLLLIEVYGFRGTLRVGAMLNGLLFISAMALALRSSRLRSSKSDNNLTPVETPVPAVRSRLGSSRGPLVLLFLTGFTSMGAEVVWIRQFTPYLLTVVYAFAAILGVYLASTFIGSRVYRIWSRTHDQEGTLVWGILGFVTILPMLTASPFLFAGLSSPLMRLTLGIAPFSGILGFVTPMLVDRSSGGDPDHAGTSYAVNVVGCILGPLAAGFLLLPVMSERWVLLAFALPWLIIAVGPRWSAGQGNKVRQAWQRTFSYALTVVAVVSVFSTKSYEDQFSQRVVLRDNTATVVATGDGMKRRLLVNGVGMTILTPMTKVMAHLPLASLNHAPQSALVVCFGMGTTYRSLLSWNIPSTAVELVPSVPQLFWYFHSDGSELLRSPLSHVVIDDGRRYLERTSEQYDVVTIDPPPPVEAAGSSLLYSKEFYSTIKRRLKDGGILQQWLPRWGDTVVQAAVAKALKESFPYVRAFHSLDDKGLHFLASNQPIVSRTARELAERMPAKAAQDLIEWGPETSAEQQFSIVLSRELPLDQLIARRPEVPALQDNRPENEYYLLRLFRDGRQF